MIIRILWTYALMLLVLIPSIMLTSQYAEGGECDTEKTTKDMLTCLESKLRTTTDELAKLKAQSEKKLTQEDKALLEKASKIWLSYRDANCASAANLYKGGSMEPVVFISCKVSMTEERIQELRQIFEEVLRGFDE